MGVSLALGEGALPGRSLVYVRVVTFPEGFGGSALGAASTNETMEELGARRANALVSVVDEGDTDGKGSWHKLSMTERERGGKRLERRRVETGGINLQETDEKTNTESN